MNTSNINDSDIFYLTFKDIKPSWSLISCAFTYGIIALFGIIFNFSVIFVTIRTKSLNGTVNYLLALCSFFEILHQLGHFLFVYTAFSGQNFIEYRLATKIIMIPMFGFGGIYPIMFFTGIDRLIGIIFDEKHNKLKIRLYLAMITIICLFYSISFCIVLYQSIDLYGDQMITGCIVDFLKNPNISIHAIIALLLVIMTVINYLFIGLLIRIKSSGLPSENSINRRVFRALFCIIFVNVGGYFINICCFLIKPSIPSPITAWFVNVIIGIPLNIGAASNGPILYFTSTDYRKAFHAEFPILFKAISNQNNQIAPQKIMVTTCVHVKPVERHVT